MLGHRTVLCCTIPCCLLDDSIGSLLLPCICWAVCLIRDQKGIFGKGVIAEIWRKLAFLALSFRWALAVLYLSFWTLFCLCSYITTKKAPIVVFCVWNQSIWYKGVFMSRCPFIEFMITLTYCYRALMNWVMVKRDVAAKRRQAKNNGCFLPLPTLYIPHSAVAEWLHFDWCF